MRSDKENKHRGGQDNEKYERDSVNNKRSQPAPAAAQAPDTANTNIPEDDLFGSGDLTTATTAEPTDTSANDQQEDMSWVIENNVPSTTTAQSSMFGDDTLTQLATASLNDGVLTNQSSANEQDSFSMSDLASPTDDSLYNNQTTQQSEDNSFSEAHSNLPSSTPMNSNQSNYADVSFTEKVSPLEAFNTRRQQEIAEKDAEEKRKIDEVRKQAKADLERWYQDRRTQMEHKRQSMKSEEEVFRTEALEKSNSTSCDWSKVVRLIEFAPGQQMSKGKRDLNRMKSTLLHASRQKPSKASDNGA